MAKVRLLHNFWSVGSSRRTRGQQVPNTFATASEGCGQAKRRNVSMALQE